MKKRPIPFTSNYKPYIDCDFHTSKKGNRENFFWNTSLHVPVFPSTDSTGPANAAKNAPYQPPEFWPLVHVLREIMYQMKWQKPNNCDLLKVGEDKDLDKQARLYIERKWGNKNVSVAATNYRCKNLVPDTTLTQV